MPGTSGGDRVSGSREKSAPVRLDVLSMLQPANEAVHDEYGDQVGPPSIPTILKSWVWLIAEHRGLTYPVGAAVDHLAGWLRRQVPFAVTRPWIGEMMREVAELRRAAHALAPWQVHVQELDAPCPNSWCEMRALIRTAGETYIECNTEVGGCGYMWSVEEYLRHVAELANGCVYERKGGYPHAHEEAAG